MVVHHLDSSVTIVSVPPSHQSLVTTPIPPDNLNTGCLLELVYPNTPTVFLQMVRTAKSKNNFMCYDVTKHHVYFIHLNMTKVMSKARDLPKTHTGQPDTDGETPKEPAASPTLPPGEVYHLVDVLYKKEMFLKRFDHFKLLDKNFVMQSEYFDAWLFKFVSK